MTTTKPTTPAVDTDDTATRVGPMHEAFAAYLNENFNAGITPLQIFLVTSQRNAFRRTDAYRVDVAKAKAAAKAAADAEKKAKAKKATEPAPVEKPAPKPAAKPAAKKATAAKAAPVKSA